MWKARNGVSTEEKTKKKKKQRRKGTRRIFGEEEDVELLYLAAAEKGDVQTLEYTLDIESLDRDCVDRKGRTSLVIALQNGHIDAMICLLQHDVHVGDALLRAVDSQFFRGVDLLCQFSRSFKGQSLNIINCRSENEDFHPDITPIILAAHHNNYDIIRLLLRYEAKIDDPSSTSDRVTEKHTLQHSLGTLNVYRALASEAYISLTSSDPIDQGFKMSVKLRDMSVKDYEFRQQYQDLAQRCEQFSADLLGETRDTEELTTILTHNQTRHGDTLLPYNVFHAVKLEQKEFVAHPHCQQLLIERWYDGLSNWRDLPMIQTIPISIAICFMYPLLSLLYIFLPFGRVNSFLNIPYVKFLMNTASYFTFLVFIFFSSDLSFIGSFGLQQLSNNVDERIDILAHQAIENQRRGPEPNILEYLIIVWLIGVTWGEMKEIFKKGLRLFIKNPHSIIDFCQLAIYWAWVALKVLAMLMVERERKHVHSVNSMTKRSMDDPEALLLRDFIDDQHQHLQNFTENELNNAVRYIISNISSLINSLHETGDSTETLSNITSLLTNLISTSGDTAEKIDPSEYGYNDVSYSMSRDSWHHWDPTLLADILFAVASVVSVLRLLRVIVISELVGPLQISLGRMNYDIVKFLFIFGFVWVAFALGMSQIYWVYAADDEIACLQEGEGTTKECNYQPFGSLSGSMETLFWSLFGLHEPDILRLKANHSSTQWFGTVLYGIYYIIAVVVLLNLLIAIMSNTYTRIEINSDKEWKFHRSEMWMSYFEADPIPPPFNIIPTPRFVMRMFRGMYLCMCRSAARKRDEKHRRKTLKKHERYKSVVSQLVLRYFADKKSGHGRGKGDDRVTRVEFMDFKQDMSSFRFEQLGLAEKLERNISLTNSHINSLILRLAQMEKINQDVLQVLQNELMTRTESQSEMIRHLGSRLEQAATESRRKSVSTDAILKNIVDELSQQQESIQQTLPLLSSAPPLPRTPNVVNKAEMEIQANEDDILLETQWRPHSLPMFEEKEIYLPVIQEENNVCTETVFDLDEDLNEFENVTVEIEPKMNVEGVIASQPVIETAALPSDDDDSDDSALSRHTYQQILGSSTPVPVLREGFQGFHGDRYLPRQRVSKLPRFQKYQNVFQTFEHSDDEQ